MLRFICRNYLRLLNVLVVVIGLVLVFTAVATFLNDDYRNEPNNAKPYVTMYASVWLILGALIATCATCIVSGITHENRTIIGCSVLAYFIISVVLIAEGSGLTVALSSTKQVAEHGRSEGSFGLSGLNRYVNDFELGVFDACCPLGISSRGECISPGLDLSGARFCYYDEDAYDAGREMNQKTDGGESVCEKFIQKNFCEATTDFPTFEENVSNFLQRNCAQIAKCLLVLGSLLFLAFVGSLYLCCCATRVEREVLVTEYVILHDQGQP